ncbi:MAG: CRTAC1 family protein, partial [Verrucomicrobiota bacterium]
NRLSQLGPGVTWTDLDADGHADLVVGTGKGGPVAAFRGDGKGGFRRMEGAPFNKPAGRDTTTVVPLGAVLIAGSANYEDGTTNGGALRIYDPVRQVSGEAVLGQGFSTGPVAAADVDGDGTLELFLGGRVLPGRYPEPAPALLLKTAGGRLSPLQRWEDFGLASGACFSDLDGDGDPDLAVALEWGPVRLLRNDGGRLVAWDPAVVRDGRTAPLSTLTGWWTAVTAGDFDGDGRLDLVAANWGWNTRYRTPAAGIRRIRAGDLTGSGAWDVIESWLDPRSGREFPERDLMSLRMLAPMLGERFGSFAQYAQTGMGDLLGAAGRNLPVRSAGELASMVFLNRGDRFEARPLPAAAQWAPAFGICVGDYDGDGREDVFLAQNWFSAQPLVQRNDAGRGLWLRGDGQGGFAADLLSGVAAYGEQRGAALADFDEDGRVDLVVAQNAGPTTLWRNVRGRPGLRVRLAGTPGNPSAFGAQVRVRHGDRRGPIREIHGGGGYWSVDDPVAVLGSADQATAIEVRWPGGRTTEHPIAPGSREIRVHPEPSPASSPSP